MVRPVQLLVLGLVLALAVPLSSVAAGPAPLAACPTDTPCTPIQHVVFMIKENRSFDSMFGTFPGANGATTFTDPQGRVLPLTHQPQSIADVCHGWPCYQTAYDNGKMDGFSEVTGAIQNGVDMADSQFYESDIPNYWTYARDFTLTDNFFSEVSSSSFPNHLFTIAGTGNNVYNSPGIPKPSLAWGCDSPAGTTAGVMNANGQVSKAFPCFDNHTLTDILDYFGLSWKYYAPGYGQPGYYWNALDAIKHVRYGPKWATNVADYQTFAADAANGNLPAVSWLVQPGSLSDHPRNGSICNGENWTVAQINAVMSNPDEWAHTAIVLVWDDYGGLYDHVPPPKGPNPQIEYGARVPAIIISPYARPGYVDSTFYSFSSLLKFVEDLWGFPSLTSFDRQSNDMFSAFDFSQPPTPAVTLSQEPCTAPTASERNYLGGGS